MSLSSINRFRLEKLIEACKAPRDGERVELLSFALLIKRFVATTKALNQSEYVQHPVILDRILYMLRDEQRDWFRHQQIQDPRTSLNHLVKIC